ncbi:unnamed protein product [Allacma fusca]|uniref:CRAL-TRIO domain-containing protein n=1 Tax=Allacma fusca TaxID=39272 RepID=A0A8J2KCM2_9HEXA|nr:unnamed protein product [Allacma fusca]
MLYCMHWYVFSVVIILSNTATALEDLEIRSVSGIQINVEENQRNNSSTISIYEITFENVENLNEKEGKMLDNYSAPYDFPKKFPYYLAGHNDDGQPIWISEGGKWITSKEIKDGHEKELAIYYVQLVYRIIKSIRDRSTDENPVTQAVLILDYSDLPFEELRHIPSVTFFLNIIKNARRLISKYLGHCIILNANAVAESALRLLQPILGGLFDRITVYGNNKAAWLPKILKIVPKQALPDWYGGSTNFLPIEVYGIPGQFGVSGIPRQTNLVSVQLPVDSAG